MNELDDKIDAAQTQQVPPATAARKTITLAELQAQIAEEVAAGPSEELIPVRFRARVPLGVAEISLSYVRDMRVGDSWTACIGPDDPHPRYVKNTLFWSYMPEDAACFASPDEALAAAKRVG